MGPEDVLGYFEAGATCACQGWHHDVRGGEVVGVVPCDVRVRFTGADAESDAMAAHAEECSCGWAALEDSAFAAA